MLHEDYSTLCRWQSCLPVAVRKALAGTSNIDIALDPTGLKAYGEGKWKVRKQGTSKRRTWRKLHIGIDVHTQEIALVALTTNADNDAQVANQLFQGKSNKLSSFRGDDTMTLSCSKF